jgi:ubiquinone/menaquinone biosynthesis C-methylase UbiE
MIRLRAVAGHRIFAAFYDRLLAESEREGLADLRSELLSGAAGRTLEIGAGTGLNLDHYPLAVTQLVLTEPDPHMAKRLRNTLGETTPVAPTEVVEASAEELPFDDTSFDTVVSTLTLCTVADPERAAAEARRVLRPDGRFLFLEHVRDADGTGRARWQDRLERPWGWVAGGCHPNRDTGQLLARTFATVESNPGEFPGSGTALVRPVITGNARP